MPDLHIRNISLTLRWWWKLYNEPESLWTVYVTRIRWQGVFSLGPMLWSKTGSFFWSQLITLKGLFNWSTTWIIGNGESIYQWGPFPLKQTGSRQQLHAISLQEAFSDSYTISLPESHNPPTLNDSDDELIWRWSPNGKYSASSIYTVMIGAGLVAWRFTGIWKFSIPPSIKIFLYLLLRDKLLTKEVMLRRQFNCNGSCVLCDSAQLESAVHLFFQCQFAIKIWDGIAVYLGNQIRVDADSVELTWIRSAIPFRHRRTARMRWQVFFPAVCWAIWRQRNLKIFEEKLLPVDVIIQWIIREASLWERHCDAQRSVASSH